MTDKTTSLQNFISEVKNNGLMKNTHFGVLINIPTNSKNEPIIKDSVASAAQLKSYIMFCDSTSLPGTSLSTVDVSPYGEIREQPTQRIYDPVSLSFYVDADLKIKRFFDLWINYIINPITRNHAYYNDYTTTVEIYVFDTEHNEKYKVTLFECYPKSVSEIQMSYGAEGIMKLNVAMQYRYYRVWDYTKNSGMETKTNIVPNAATLINPDTQYGLENLQKKDELDSNATKSPVDIIKSVVSNIATGPQTIAKLITGT